MVPAETELCRSWSDEKDLVTTVRQYDVPKEISIWSQTIPLQRPQELPVDILPFTAKTTTTLTTLDRRQPEEGQHFTLTKSSKYTNRKNLTSVI